MGPIETVAHQPELRDYLQVLRRRRTLVGASLAVIVTAAIGMSYLTDRVYEATAKLLLKPRSTQVFSSDTIRAADAGRMIQTEIEVMKTEPVKSLVRAKIGDAPQVQVRPVGETDIVTVRAESTDPKWAAAVANAYATAYIDFRRQQALDDLAAGSEGVQIKIAELQRQIDDLAAQLDAAPACADPKATPAACNQRTNIEQSVGLRRSTLLNQQAVFRSKLDQLQVDSALANGGAQVVTPASVPSEPFEPRPARNIVLGIALGLIVGVGVALLAEYLDDSIKSKEDLERAMAGVPVLGLVPLVPNWKARDEGRVVSIQEPGSSAAEAYRILRTAIQFLGLDGKLRVIQITSPSPREGKTTTLANLAVAFASAGLRTIVVDCDLRRPRLHQFYGLTNDVGFTSVLLGQSGLASALKPVPGQDRLLVLASGPLPPNPSELLSSRRAAELIENLSSQADMVLIDSPPCLPVTDALVLSQRVDSTIMVATARATSRRAASRTLEMLQQVSAPLTGAVLNGVTADAGYGYYRSNYRYEPRSSEVIEAAPNGSAPNKSAQRHRRRRAPTAT